jgi:ketosteroid isomerase-like protein
MAGAFDPGEPVSYTAAGDWLESYVRARRDGDGDRLLELFSPQAELQPDPFDAPLVGQNAIRAYFGELDERQTQRELTIERHWASGSTILAAWHESVVRRADRSHVRQAGMLTAEIRAGRCSRLRLWSVGRGPSE